MTHAHLVLHGGESEVRGDAGYQGVRYKRPEHQGREVDWQVAMRPGRRRRLDKASAEEAAEKRKASIRAKVEHPFLYVKRHFGYSKVRYRGLAKNTQRIAMLLGFTNLLIAGRYRGRLIWGWCLWKPQRASRTPRKPPFLRRIGANTRISPQTARALTASRPM